MDETFVKERKVYRDSIDAHRETYFVTYTPAIWCRPHATVSLTFLSSGDDQVQLKNAMEQELELWLKQYHIPTVVMAFDTTGSLIQVPSDDEKGCLTGYVDPENGHIVRYWRLLGNDELPSGQLDEKYFSKVYETLPSRSQESVRAEAIRKARTAGRSIRVIVFLVVGVPVLIEVVSLGIDWIGYLLSGISITVGFYKLGKTMGWIKPNRRDGENAEKARKMEHYYYHCEKNPEAFNKLKLENFKREAIEDTLRESEEIKRQK